MQKETKHPFALFAAQEIGTDQLLKIKGGDGEGTPPDPGIVVITDTFDI